MSVLRDLSKSVSEMSTDELRARIRQLRISRSLAPEQPTRAPKKATKVTQAKRPVDIKEMLGSMGKEEAMALLALLEGATGGTKE